MSVGRQVLIEALSTAVLPVLNSFLLLLLITSIYAVLATDLFAHSHHRLFGNFLRSMWTLFQVRPQGLFVYVSAHQVSFAYL